MLSPSANWELKAGKSRRTPGSCRIMMIDPSSTSGPFSHGCWWLAWHFCSASLKRTKVAQSKFVWNHVKRSPVRLRLMYCRLSEENRHRYTASLSNPWRSKCPTFQVPSLQGLMDWTFSDQIGRGNDVRSTVTLLDHIFSQHNLKTLAFDLNWQRLGNYKPNLQNLPWHYECRIDSFCKSVPWAVKQQMVSSDIQRLACQLQQPAAKLD